MPGSWEQWTGHVIVCGLQGVGLRTVEQLRVAEVPVVVLDDDPSARMAALVESWGCPHFKSDGDPAAGICVVEGSVCPRSLTPPRHIRLCRGTLPEYLSLDALR